MEEDKNLWQEDQTSKDLKLYLEIARKTTAFGLGIILFFYLLSLISFLEWNKSVLNWISWVIIFFVLLVVCYRVAKIKKEESAHAATTGALIGFIFGLWHALLQIIWFWSWWMILDLILEPLAVSVAGLIIGLVIAKILKIKNNKPEAEKDTASEEENNYDKKKKRSKKEGKGTKEDGGGDEG